MRITYTASVDPDVKYPLRQFQQELELYLADPDGWASHGYEFVPVTRNPQVFIRLSSPATLQKSGCGDGRLSCAELGGKRMYLNAHRWTHGAAPSRLPLEDYRQYMVSHEMGHILGHDHMKCPGPGHPAPIMMQQTLGIGACTPSTKVGPPK
jgi:hypothetical protein